MTAPVRAPWVRTRLRVAPLASLLTAALAFGAVFLAVAMPRALERATDQALHAYLQHADPTATELKVSAPVDTRTKPSDRLTGLGQVLTAVSDQAGPDLPFDLGNTAYGEKSFAPRELTDPGLARPDGLNPQLELVYLAHSTDHASLVSGRWPAAHQPAAEVVEIALSQDTARTLGVHLGQLLHTNAPGDVVVVGRSVALTARVVGLFAAHDPAGRFWAGVPCGAKPCLTPSAGDRPPPLYWNASALVSSDSLTALSTGTFEPPVDFWRLALDTAKMRGDRLDAALSTVAGFQSGPSLLAVSAGSGRTLSITSELPGLFAEEEARQAAIRPLTAVGPAGLAGVVAVVLCLAAGLTAERRATELHLLRARGGSRRDLLLRLLGEGACTVVPAAALAIPLALELLPTAHWLTPVMAGLGAALLALLAVPVRTLARDGLALRPAARRRGRRLVGELALLAAAVAAVLEVRRRGVAGLDPLLIAAPLLLAAVGAMLLARSQPLLVGGLARVFSTRGTGVVGFVGLSRAARGTGDRRRPSVLPLLALTLVVTTAGFGAATLQSVVDSRAASVRSAVGGDASVTAPTGSTLPASVIRALATLPGLRVGTFFWEQDDVSVWNGGPTMLRATVVAVDPQTYARVAATIGRGGFDPALLTDRPAGTGGTIPALVSADIAGTPSTDHGYQLHLADESELQITAVGTVTGTPALQDPTASVVVVPAGPAATQVPAAGRPGRWLGVGSVSDARLHAVVPSGDGVDTSAAHVAALANDPSQSAATGIFWDCTAATWCFAMLAVLLAVVRAGPERAALLARLRTMGLRPRQGLRLILAESLPQTLTAALGGGLTATAAVLLLGPTVDLSPLVGATVPTGLTLSASPILGQTLIVAGLAAAVVLAEAAVSGRRQITIELRAGDGR